MAVPQRIPEPPQQVPPGVRPQHRIAPRHGMAVPLHAVGLIEQRALRRRQHDPGRPTREHERTRSGDAAPHGGTGLVVAAENDLRVGRQAPVRRHLRPHRPRHGPRLRRLGQLAGRYAQALQQLRRPGPARDVIGQRARGVRGVQQWPPRQAPDDEVGHQREAARAAEDLGRLLAPPQDARGGGEGRRRRAREAEPQVPLPLHPRDLARRAAVHPRDGRGEGLTGRIQRHDGIALGGDGQGGDAWAGTSWTGRRARTTWPVQDVPAHARHDLPHALARQPPPVLGVLLDPARLRGAVAVLALRLGEHLSICVAGQRLDRRGADIEPEVEVHAGQSSRAARPIPVAGEGFASVRGNTPARGTNTYVWRDSHVGQESRFGCRRPP